MKRMGGDVTVGKWEIHPGCAVVKVKLHHGTLQEDRVWKSPGVGERQCIMREKQHVDCDRSLEAVLDLDSRFAGHIYP